MKTSDLNEDPLFSCKPIAFFADGPVQETLLEKVLYNCECIKVAVINILEAHAQGQDSQHGVCKYTLISLYVTHYH